ncbi:MAG TPA: sulfatase-like hydrolase/transferase [Bryobacteraceae bacterium]|nr:sulfatase-like hydrolase/transferase [Bryobacteraceae bacterium]
MVRRKFLESALAGAAVRSSAGGPLVRPNFLFLIADDLTYRGIHSLNNPEVKTPNLDRLVKRGCTFTHSFHQGSWSGAVCIASRTMLNCGLTAFRAQRRIEQAPLWGETLGAAGYDTSIVGKWHLSDRTLKRSFKEIGPVSGGMFESGPAAYNRPSPGNTWTPWDESLKGQWLETKTWQPGAPEKIKHSARVWAETASGYLLKRARTANPFFLYVGFNSPHDPRQAPKEFVDRYPRNRIQIPPNYLPEHPFDQGDKRIRDELLAPFPRSREAVQLHRSEYYAHITYMDAQVGQVLDALDGSGQAANTYVIFTADHGLAVGQHGLMGKQNLYDHSIRMPLLISGPGVPAGKRVDEMVYQHSLFATTCELAVVAAPGTLEFPSLVDLWKGPGREKHDAIFSYYRGFQRAVRTHEHKLIVYPQAGVTQLFDLDTDPWEIHDLAGERKYSALRSTLLERLRRFQRELGDDLPPIAAPPGD